MIKRCNIILDKKKRDLTQSYDETPYTNRKFNNQFEFELLVFYVTCNGISVIYVTAQMCRRTEEEEVVPTVGLQTP